MKSPRAALFSASLRKTTGMALVVSLSIIVLITAVVLAFFARATANRVVESSRSNRVEAEELAKTASDYLTSGFLQEIVAHSITNSIYLPTSSAFAVPQRSLPAAIGSDTNFANLLRRSLSTDGETNASAHGTATTSRNGRSVGTSRWNTPLLLSAPGLNNTNQLPNWIYVNADGGVTNAPGTNTVGRFAYIVYDVGGLLDANVAGYPSSATAVEISKLKGTLAGADLSVIPGVSDANAFVRWRNATTASSYVANVTNAAANGFLQATAGDCRLSSRQDLINLARGGIYGITTNALPYLTHFTRELARPSLPNNGLMNMTSRYDLSRLSSLANTGLAGAAPNFTYTNTLSASNSRANPDIFQVLRSAIAFTNSWETAGPATGGLFSPPGWTTNLNLRAVSIGANVIDQFAGSTQPTRVVLGSERVAGRKPLPMVMQVFLAYNISTNSTATNVNFSIIPQVWSPSVPATATTITASIVSGQIAVGGSTNALPVGATVTNSVVAGAVPVYASTNANPALRGFFATSVPLTNAAPTPLDVSLTGLTLLFKTAGSTNAYSAFGNSTGDLTSATLSGNVTLTNAISASSTVPGAATNGLEGMAITTSDPRTLQLAGARVAFSGTNALASALPLGALTNYGGNITDTNFAAPTNRVSCVGELGRVFRESPWRTMDFVSASSPDKAVLDAFSAYPTPSGGLRAGVINLNSRQGLVLAAMLSGTVTTATFTLSRADAMMFGANMVSSTSTNALTNRAQLVDLVANNILARPVATDPQKEVREAAICALGEVGQTRTWNLMFDIVAQAGSFPANSTTPDSFRVQGEQRRWTHIAIDRPTAKVVDQATEVSSE